MKKLVPVLLALLSFACEKEGSECEGAAVDRPDQADCVARALERHGMVAYTGQAIDECAIVLVQYKYEGESFFNFDATCISFAPLLLDCDGNRVCLGGDSDSEDCRVVGFCGSSERVVVGVME